MSFDAQSRERLEALGRRLPQKLPPPLPAPAAPGSSPPEPASAPRHRLETEENPEALFRALMQASSDGSVPPHLLDRLRELERRPSAGALSGFPAPGSVRDAGSAAGSPPTGTAAPARRSGPPRGKERSPRRPLDPAQVELYAAFDDLLHGEGDDSPETPPRPSRPANDRLLPRPTLRQSRPGS
jgi:hypothetical protein